jgi:hypothetical protein
VLGSHSELNACLEAKTKELALEEEHTYLLKEIRLQQLNFDRQEEAELEGLRAEIAAMERKNKVCVCGGVCRCVCVCICMYICVCVFLPPCLLSLCACLSVCLSLSLSFSLSL